MTRRAASKTAAETAETNAETAETNAAATYDLFDDRMLGSKTVDPTLDNDSNALAEGAMYWNSTNKVLRIYDGSAWQDTGSATANITEWTATAGQTTFSGLDDNSLSLAYTAGYLMVFRNGTLLDPDDYTATSGSSVVLDTGADLDDTLNFIGFGTFDVANTYTKTEADATFAPIARPGDNLIINGSFLIWQRDNSLAIVAAINGIVSDRWNILNSTTGAYTVSRVSTLGTSGLNSTYTHMIDVTTADTSIAASVRCWMEYNMEGIDAAQLALGYSDARTVTLSFWSRHTKAGTHCVCFKSSARTRSYIAEYTQAVSGTWEKHEITVDLDTTGTWLYGVGVAGLRVMFILAAGSNYHGAADTWLGVDDIATSNQVNNLDDSNNFFRLGDVKLEIGSVATDFVQRPFTEELQLCMRYYEKSFRYDTVPTNGVGISTASPAGVALNSSSIYTSKIDYRVIKAKETATVTFYRDSNGATDGRWDYYTGSWSTPTSDPSVYAASDMGFQGNMPGCTTAQYNSHLISGHWTSESEI